MKCLTRTVKDKDEQILIDVQIDNFKKRAKYFCCRLTTRSISLKTPIEWWESYIDEHPKLKKFVICVLSLTCSSSGCECN